MEKPAAAAAEKNTVELIQLWLVAVSIFRAAMHQTQTHTLTIHIFREMCLKCESKCKFLSLRYFNIQKFNQNRCCECCWFEVRSQTQSLYILLSEKAEASSVHTKQLIAYSSSMMRSFIRNIQRTKLFWIVNWFLCVEQHVSVLENRNEKTMRCRILGMRTNSGINEYTHPQQ